jgi:ubiquinone/menaquinone biosynthesis C-methylase UbiE
MLRHARARIAEARVPVDLHAAGAESVPFDDDRFDTVVITWTLCTVGDPAATLAEVRRVLRPGGRLLFIEHTRSIQRPFATAQTLLTPLWRRVMGGCHLDRAAVDVVRASGLVLDAVLPVGRERWTCLPVYRGAAVKPRT